MHFFSRVDRQNEKRGFNPPPKPLQLGIYRSALRTSEVPMTNTDAKRKRPGGGMPGRVEMHSLAGSRKMRRQPSKNSRFGQAAALVADPRFRRRVQHLERLGNRVTGELLAQLAVEHDCRPMIERWIDRAIEHEDQIKAFGLHEWPPLPLRAVR